MTKKVNEKWNDVSLNVQNGWTPLLLVLITTLLLTSKRTLVIDAST